MDNTKKPLDFTRKTAHANKSTFNCLNPDNTYLVMKGKEWVNPLQPTDFRKENKQMVKSIVQ